MFSDHDGTSLSSAAVSVLPNNAKLGDTRGVAYVTWPTFKFRDPFYISGTAEATNFKFGVVTWPTLNFGTPSISVERLKLRTSNLVCKMITRSTTKYCKIRGSQCTTNNDALGSFSSIAISVCCPFSWEIPAQFSAPPFPAFVLRVDWTELYQMGEWVYSFLTAHQHIIRLFSALQWCGGYGKRD